jgi:hypothetical protein
MGSGSLNAMAVFEQGYKDDMTKEEAMELAARAIRRWGGLGHIDERGVLSMPGVGGWVGGMGAGSHCLC